MKRATTLSHIGIFPTLKLFLILILFFPSAVAGISSVISADKLASLNSMMALDQVQGKAEEIEEHQELKGTHKEKLLDLYRLAEEYLRTAKAYKDSANTYKQAIESVPNQIEKINKDLESPSVDKAMAALEKIPDNSPLLELEQHLTQEKAKLAALEGTLTGLDKQLQKQQPRLRQARDQLTEAKQRQEQIESNLKAPPREEEISLLSEARQLASQARLKACLNKIEMLEQELLSHNSRLQLLRAQRDLTARQVSQAQARVKFLQKLIGQRRQAEVGQVQEGIARAEQEAAGKHPVVQQLAEQNARLGKELASLVANLGQIPAKREAAESQLKLIADQSKSAQQRLEIAGLNEALQQILQEQRRSLPELSAYQAKIRRHRQEMADVGISQLRIDEQRHQFGSLNEAVRRVMAGQVGSQLSPSHREEIKAEVHKLLKDQQSLLDKLSTTQTQYLLAVGDLDFAQRQLIDEVEHYENFLDEHLLWIPSAPPLGAKTWRNLLAGMGWLLSLDHWLETARTLGSVARDKSLLVSTVILIFIGLILVRHHLGTFLETTAERTSMLYADRFSFTIRALIMTLLAAAPWPLLTVFTGWLLLNSGEAPEFGKAVGIGLIAISLPLFIMHGFQLLCRRDNGVAEAHFGWHQQVVAIWWRNITWALPIVLPALFIMAMAQAQTIEAYAESFGRIGFIVNMAVFALFFQRVLKPKGGIAERHLAEQPKSWLSRFRYVWYSAVIALPIALIGLAAMGYLYTALHLKNGIIATLRLAMVAVLIHDLIIRWLVVTQRKLALLKLRERREAERVTHSTREAASRSGEGVPAKLDIPQVDIQTINTQTRQLLHTLIGVSLAIGFWLIWAPTFPALGIFNDITLWHHAVTVKGQEIQKPFTLANLALTLALALVAFGATKNFPGVLEIVVLRRLSLEPGSRYAITALSRYGLGILGIVLVFESIGGSWPQIQWLIAALTVGLGFGLQEIFANFVSGLIILFERPIRVGDVVTVGDVSGTVSRIRIRATMLTDFDRKELIIPNKAFITERLVNWTLSDPITRVTLKIGIAYGSDTALAHQVILGVVNSNPLVLEEPNPSVYFVGFEEGVLDFIVWAFVRELGNRYPLIHELNTAINRALREQGIEIPLPQRDIHVRSVATISALKELSSQEEEKAGQSLDLDPKATTESAAYSSQESVSKDPR